MIKKITAFFVLLSAVIMPNVQAQTDTTDITGLGGAFSAQYTDETTTANLSKAFDNDISSLFITYHDSLWLEYQAPGYFVVTKYSITSSTYKPERDPGSWVLTGSLDGENWDTLDAKAGEEFSGRLMKRVFTVENTSKGYMYFRIYLKTKASTTLQLAELEFLGIPQPDGSSSAPLIPSELLAAAVSSSQLNLTWKDNSDNESWFRLERSTDSVSWKLISVLSANDSAFADTALTDETYYYYRICAQNNSGSSDYAYSPAKRTDPMEIWKEHWYEHNQYVKRVFFDDDVVVYYDDQMDTTQSWLLKFVGDIWRYAKKTYGIKDKHLLYVVLHQGRYGGGHAFYSYGDDHDYKSGIDVALGSWYKQMGDQVEIPIHETGHVIESMAFDTYTSPAFHLWGDSKWMEIYNYDVYLALDMDSYAENAYSRYMNNSDNFPTANSRWFRNWFYPIYNNYGKTEVLVKFFKLMSENFPKNGQTYTRDMNYGELFHFWSGAAGTNLRDQATKAFGWSTEFENQFNQAKKDFPNITYENIAVDDNDAPEVITSYELSQNYPNPFNPSTVINYKIKNGSHVNVKVYDILGNEITTLVNEYQPSGSYNVTFDASKNLAGGIYFYRITAGKFVETKKMIFLK